MSDTQKLVRLRYSRETHRYWVFERGANEDKTLPDTMVTAHIRKTGGTRPDYFDVVLTPGLDAPNVQGGRWVEPE